MDIFCGYVEAPLRIIGLFLAIIQAATGLSVGGNIQAFTVDKTLNENISLFFSLLYYSVVTFTTVGYSDFTPVGLSRAITAIEAFTGSFTIALFVVVFVKKMTR
ncbi:MAG TPA: hypothetical protein DIS98_00295 [Colwellia sp.]|nr:hypothetical protein [Colwellia sp.]